MIQIEEGKAFSNFKTAEEINKDHQTRETLRNTMKTKEEIIQYTIEILNERDKLLKITNKPNAIGYLLATILSLTLGFIIGVT